eukprot:15460222-Alexandrium_andersonii.AAC.1
MPRARQYRAGSGLTIASFSPQQRAASMLARSGAESGRGTRSGAPAERGLSTGPAKRNQTLPSAGWRR